MSRRATIALGALAGFALVLLMAWLMEEKPAPRPLSAGCSRAPNVRHLWVCGDGVYVIVGRLKEWAGPLSALGPMPAPPPFVRKP